MQNNYTNVVVNKEQSQLIDINPEYVYMTIPAEYVCVYHKILITLADYGVELIKDCAASCTKKNIKIIDCFNMFNAAIAARKLNKTKEAELMIKYINAELDLITKGEDNCPSIVFPVDDKGEIQAIVGCGSIPRFQINAEDGQLYEEYINKLQTKTDVYVLGEEDHQSE